MAAARFRKSRLSSIEPALIGHSKRGQPNLRNTCYSLTTAAHQTRMNYMIGSRKWVQIEKRQRITATSLLNKTKVSVVAVRLTIITFALGTVGC